MPFAFRALFLILLSFSTKETKKKWQRGVHTPVQMRIRSKQNNTNETKMCIRKSYSISFVLLLFISSASCYFFSRASFVPAVVVVICLRFDLICFALVRKPVVFCFDFRNIIQLILTVYFGGELQLWCALLLPR